MNKAFEEIQSAFHAAHKKLSGMPELLCNVSAHPKQHAQLPMLVHQLLHATPEAAFGHQESVAKDFSACEECQYNFVSEYTKQSLF